VPVQVAVADHLGDDAAQEGTAAHVVTQRGDAGNECWRTHDPAHAKAGRDDFGEARDLDAVVAIAQCEQRRRRGRLEPEFPVRVVFEDEGLVLPRELQQFVAPLQRECAARRVLVRGDAVDELSPLPLVGELLEFGGKDFGAHAVLVHRNRHLVRAEGADGAHAAGEVRAFDHDVVASVEQGFADHANGMGRAARDDDVVARHRDSFDAR